MQFTGHSLSVHQSMSVPWEIFSSSHFISQFPPTRFPLLTAIGMCHFLSGASPWMAFWAGSKGQNITIIIIILIIMSCHKHRFPWLSLSLSLSSRLHRQPLPACLQGYILYQYRYVVDRFLLFTQQLWRGPLEYVTYKFVLLSPVVSLMSGSSNLDCFRDFRWWPYSCFFVGYCFQELVQYITQHSCVIAVKLFSPSVQSASKRCIHIAVLTQHLFRKNSVLSYRTVLTFIWPIPHQYLSIPTA